MTTKDEQIKIALDALDWIERCSSFSGQYVRSSVNKKAAEAITAIKQAITPETGNAANPEASAITAGNGQAQEPVAWEATTPGYIKYVTDKQYRSYSETAKRWYKPFKCSNCTAPKQAEPAEKRKLYECTGCGHIYMDKVAQCDCLENPANTYNDWIASPTPPEAKA